MHSPGRRNVADALRRNPDFVCLNALLAVVTRRAAAEARGDTFYLPAAAAAADSAVSTGQQLKGSKDSPASGANCVPFSNKRGKAISGGVTQQSTDTSPSSSSSASVAADDGELPQQFAEHAASDELHDAIVIDDIIEAYAADSCFADEKNTASMTHVEGLLWREGRIVLPNSADTKRMILEAMHDHPLTGHLGVTKTLKSRPFQGASTGEMLIWRCVITSAIASVANCKLLILQSPLA